MKFIQADIDSIATAKENDSLTVFVGAGFSKFSETDIIKFPSWGDLIKTLKSELSTDETDYLKVAQLYHLEFGEYKLYQKLREFIPLHATPSEFHLQVFQVLQPKYIITTNWDNLLEKTIYENGFTYDVVKTESDLIKSTLPNKLIKIHGDFDAHNIIFTEDDYLSYSINNPLFDNFLKHILSTTTVLFLGYSYSDIDLKQIVKWIEKNSKISPPRFLLNMRSESSQKKYLENHGIKHLEVRDECKEYKELYENFFTYVEKTISGELFLEKDEVYDDSVITYFYTKLSGLNELNTLLPEQITNVFSNCSMKYHHNCFGLEFHHNALTMDYDSNVRKIYARFFELLKYNGTFQIFREKMSYIFSSFISAGIVFVEYDNFIFNIAENFDNLKSEDKFDPERDNISKFISFSRKMPVYNFNVLTFHSKSTDEKLEIFKNLSSEVTSKLVKKQYLSAMISKFNKTIFAYNLSTDPDINQELRDRFRKESQYEFTNELINNKYPSQSKAHFQPLVDLLNFRSIYKFHYDSIVDSSELLKAAENNKNGGFSFNHKEQRSNDYLIQLLRFCADNDITLDVYSEFKNLMVSYVTGKFKLSKVKENFSLSIFDLFIIVKYFKFKDLWDLLVKYVMPFVKEESTEGSAIKYLYFSGNEKLYISKVFDNLSDLFIKHSHSFYANKISDSFLNLMLALGLFNWSNEELEKFINRIKSVLLKSDIPRDCIKSINYFTVMQYKLYKTKSDKFLELIDVVLEGFISGKFRAPIYQRVNSDLSDVYLYFEVNNMNYSNKKLVDKAIFFLEKDFEGNEQAQRFFLQEFFLPIYPISNNEVRSSFTEYFDSLRVNNWNEVDEGLLYKEIFRELSFLQYGCEVREHFVTFFIDWIKHELDENVYSSLEFLKEGGIEYMLRIIEYLNNQRHLEQFREVFDIVQSKRKEFSEKI